MVAVSSMFRSHNHYPWGPESIMNNRNPVSRRDTLGLGALTALAALWGNAKDAHADPVCGNALAADLSGLKAVRVFTGEDGHSHFEDIVLPGKPLPFRLQHDSKVTPGFVGFYASKATQISILHGPPDLDLPWHNAPSSAHEFFFMLQGSNMLITRNATRLIVPGTITIFEDATGSGHAGKVGSEGYTVLSVTLDA
jgi:hypothetical protein